MNKEEAKKLCERYKVNLALYPNTVVTSNGNIYTSGKVDPKDTSEQIKMSSDEKEIQKQEPEVKTEGAKKTRKK